MSEPIHIKKVLWEIFFLPLVIIGIIESFCKKGIIENLIKKINNEDIKR